MTPEAEPPKTPAPQRLLAPRMWLLLLLLGVSLFFLVRGDRDVNARRVPYSEIVTLVADGRVESADVRPEEISAKVRGENGKPAETVVADRLPGMDEHTLVEAMEQKHVVITGQSERAWGWRTVVWGIAPWIAIALVMWGLSRAAGAAVNKGNPMMFGRSKAVIYDKAAREEPVTFAEVAGVDEAKAELQEVVRFLKEPAKYRSIGAHVPKGVLLVGAPGTGKTLLAKAVAGESGVPFFSISGSEFVEMFVGVGASRVRDLFQQAKSKAPCIIFVDELDAVGKARSGAAGFVANEEREQTLNQLLVEMDGFDSGTGLIVMAATNRPEILDRALLRAGRFDRQLIIERPDLAGREAILRVHAKKVKLAVDVDLHVIAQRTPGMVGSDLANTVNEAALASVRRNSEIVTASDFEEAIDRIQLGLRKEGRVMSPEERSRVAIHEGGHALVALTMKHADPVHRVTIIPRSVGALGHTLQLPTEEHMLLTKGELRDRLCVMMGGRSAEELVCDDISTGAENDLQVATELARHMVCRFGMSDRVGLGSFSHGADSPFLGLTGDPVDRRNMSEETAREIDHEVKKLLDEEHARARKVLTERRASLDAVAAALLARETLTSADLAEIVKAPVAEPRPTGPAPQTA